MPTKPFFEFDKASLVSIQQLREAGFVFTELRIGDRVVLIPAPSLRPPSKE